MHRRTLLFAFLSTVALPAGAQNIETDVVNELRAQGFRDIEARRTLFGRTRIIGERGGLRREVIVNPRTQTILRDHLTGDDGDDDWDEDDPDNEEDRDNGPDDDDEDEEDAREDGDEDDGDNDDRDNDDRDDDDAGDDEDDDADDDDA